MSPKLTLLLTFAGVLAAGVPLLWLTQKPESPQMPASAAAEQPTEPVFATLRATGTPSEIALRYHGRLLVEIKDACPWEGELALPTEISAADIEVEVLWPTPGEQAVTLTLEPAGREACSCTRWADAGVGKLHDIFTFVW